MTRLFDWYLNLSVKWRLTGFVFCLLLLVVSAGTGGLLGMRTANRALSSVYFDQVLIHDRYYGIRDLVEETLGGNVEAFIHGHAPADKVASELATGRKKISQLLAGGPPGVLGSGADGPGVYGWERALALVDAAAGKIQKALQDGREDAVIEISDGDFYPSVVRLRNEFQSVYEQQRESSKRRFEHAQKVYDWSKRAFALTLLFGLSLSVIAATVLIRSINAPLSMMMEAILRIRRGDLTRRLDYGRRDEFEVLIEGYNGMADYLANLVQRIQTSGIQVTSSVTELAATALQQEASANELAATCTEIAASSNEIAATSVNLLHTMNGLTRAIHYTADAASQGHEGLTDIDRTMSSMEDATSAIVSKLAVLNEKAGNIAGMVKLINKVADQTNLLSLNAAIEAEKAGDYGAGFAVVATEIRRLADQTAVAAYDIEQMVQEVQSAVSAGVMGMDKFAENVRKSVTDVRHIGVKLSEVIQQVESLPPNIREVNDGMESQSQGAQQISESIAQLNESAQQAAESLSQTSDTIAKLKDVAMGLQQSIAAFRAGT